MKIDESIGYWLALLSRAHRNRVQQQLSALGLYSGQEILLMQLWSQDGQIQSELADRLHIQQATLTRMIDRMSQSGLLVRKTDPKDGRISRVYLTKEGKSLQDPVESIWQKSEEQTFSKLTLEERLLIRRLMMQIHDDLRSD